jgi:hypothetical protein
MSTYELVFPDPERPARVALLLAVLNLDEANLRVRDAWTERVKDRLRIALYTRAGGDNRPDYAEGITKATRSPYYLSDRDDDLDSTYATFRFAWPSERLGKLMDVVLPASHDGEVDTDQRWHDAFARLERGEITPQQVAGFDQVTAAIRNAVEGNGPPIVNV